jgi:gamma-glutamyl hercynylcysteine S-oxide synthase
MAQGGFLMLAASGLAQERQQLLARLADARRQSDAIFLIPRPESFYDRPIPERHRIVFYIGHLEAFDWNLMRERVLSVKTFNPEFDRLFAFGIDPVGGGLPTDQPADWPSIIDVRDYVMQVREALDTGLARATDETASLLLQVAIEHRLMHAETLAYMLHQLDPSSKIEARAKMELVTNPMRPRMLQIPAGVATLGLSNSADQFGWDNEYQAHEVSVPAFEIDQFMVTNGDYLKFVNAGGYENRSFWDEEGWKWKTEQNISKPVFWNRVNGEWRYRTMFSGIPMPANWPVYVSHAEASAYARWAGKALPSEAQWHRAAYGTAESIERRYPWGEEAPDPKRGNFDFQRWDPTPVGAFPQGSSAFGAADMLGNGWEWTSSVFASFEGFEPFPFYPGYSANFFDGKHYVIKGGSGRTAACMLRRSFRNWFQAHYQYVYAGFRCVSN